MRTLNMETDSPSIQQQLGVNVIVQLTGTNRSDSI